MYQSHDMLWLLPVALVFWLIAAVTSVLHKRRQLNVPRWVPGVCALGFAGCIIGMAIMRGYDNLRERQVLRGIDAAQVSRLTLSRGGRTMEIGETNSIGAIFAELKAVSNISAHHTHSLDFVDVAFEYQRQQFFYHIGRDSERPDEYWVQAAGGRIKSATFGPLIDKLLGNVWMPPPK